MAEKTEEQLLGLESPGTVGELLDSSKWGDAVRGALVDDDTKELSVFTQGEGQDRLVWVPRRWEWEVNPLGHLVHSRGGLQYQLYYTSRPYPDRSYSPAPAGWPQGWPWPPGDQLPQGWTRLPTGQIVPSSTVPAQQQLPQPPYYQGQQGYPQNGYGQQQGQYGQQYGYPAAGQEGQGYPPPWAPQWAWLSWLMGSQQQGRQLPGQSRTLPAPTAAPTRSAASTIDPYPGRCPKGYHWVPSALYADGGACVRD